MKDNYFATAHHSFAWTWCWGDDGNHFGSNALKTVTSKMKDVEHCLPSFLGAFCSHTLQVEPFVGCSLVQSLEAGSLKFVRCFQTDWMTAEGAWGGSVADLRLVTWRASPQMNQKVMVLVDGVTPQDGEEWLDSSNLVL